MKKTRHSATALLTAAVLLTAGTPVAFASSMAGGSRIKYIMWVGLGLAAFVDLVYELRRWRRPRRTNTANAKGNRGARRKNLKKK